MGYAYSRSRVESRSNLLYSKPSAPPPLQPAPTCELSGPASDEYERFWGHLFPPGWASTSIPCIHVQCKEKAPPLASAPLLLNRSSHGHDCPLELTTIESSCSDDFSPLSKPKLLFTT
ncbi:hypothetical protein COLO4_36958 [Corchorus olitorius]|uniref:Uncharacterized protein n=1 Tax=Corchorus olitorius TaxID=93759 RepID=A0A1R3G3Z4_9ROSI|nr:hypothetical protein COLO4_36958 [Corchorus olitorius]